MVNMENKKVESKKILELDIKDSDKRFLIFFKLMKNINSKEELLKKYKEFGLNRNGSDGFNDGRNLRRFLGIYEIWDKEKRENRVEIVKSFGIDYKRLLDIYKEKESLIRKNKGVCKMFINIDDY